MSETHAVILRARAVDYWVNRSNWLYEVMLVALGGRLRKALPHIRGPKVLEVSFGTGYLMSHYAARFETSGVDYNPLCVERAKDRMARLGLRAQLIQGDAHALPYADASFDTLVNTDAFSLYEDPSRAMREFYRVLAPGGRLVLMELDYPRRRHWLGTRFVDLWRWMKIPHLSYDPLLRDVGFDYEDVSVGIGGALHLYLATKPTLD